MQKDAVFFRPALRRQPPVAENGVRSQCVLFRDTDRRQMKKETEKMKKNEVYEAPKAEILHFDTQDFIRTSDEWSDYYT